MAAGSIAADVTDADFQAAVIERSKTIPVVVDFWAPWCGPCRVLGPIIERVAGELAGKVELVKLNTDENPRTATAFQIQGIPAVKAFIGGKVAHEFTGALPEPQVRAFFAKLAPSPAQERTAMAAELARAGDLAGAEREYRAALQAEPSSATAITGLAALLLERGDRDEAESLLERAPRDRRAKAMKHRLFLDDFAARHSGEDLEGEARANPRDARARYRYGVLLAAREDYAQALDELLESVRLDRNMGEGAARKAMLAVFDILGMEHALTRDYQRRLSTVLF